ncbi:MAG: hypothetical protein LN409_05095 [Candidatus Thermoplasmatota archaeon]|nr:hypothetical protein [Candidatus Thermoplasmatota archaeon]
MATRVFMTMRFINSFEVVDLTEKDDDRWVTLRDMRGEKITVRVSEYTASDLHIGGVVGLYLEV